MKLINKALITKETRETEGVYKLHSTILFDFSIEESIISGIILPDKLPFAREHILAGSHSLLL